MAGPVHTEDATDPGDNFVGGRVGGLIEVDDARLDVRLEVSLEGRASVRNGREMGGADEELVLTRRGRGIEMLVPVWEVIP